jgi:hypothetical protein
VPCAMIVTSVKRHASSIMRQASSRLIPLCLVGFELGIPTGASVPETADGWSTITVPLLAHAHRHLRLVQRHLTPLLHVPGRRRLRCNSCEPRARIPNLCASCGYPKDGSNDNNGRRTWPYWRARARAVGAVGGAPGRGDASLLEEHLTGSARGSRVVPEHSSSSESATGWLAAQPVTVCSPAFASKSALNSFTSPHPDA